MGVRKEFSPCFLLSLCVCVCVCSPLQYVSLPPVHKSGHGPHREWYEPGKLLRLFSPYRFSLTWCGVHNSNEFIWFELVYHGPPESDSDADHTEKDAIAQ